MPIRKILILLFVVFNAHSLFAQDTIVRKRFVEYYVGGNRSDVSKTYQFKNDYVNPKFGFNMGLFFGRNISKHFQIGSGLCYDQFHYKIRLHDYSDNQYQYGFYEYRFHLASIPIYLKSNFQINSKLKIGLKVGLNVYTCPLYEIVDRLYSPIKQKNVSNGIVVIGFRNPATVDYNSWGGLTPYSGILQLRRQMMGYFATVDLSYQVSKKIDLNIYTMFKTFDVNPFPSTRGYNKQFQFVTAIGIAKRIERQKIKPTHKKLDYTFGDKKSEINIGNNNIAFEPIGFITLGLNYERVKLFCDDYWVAIRGGVGLFPNSQGVLKVVSTGFSVLHGTRKTKFEGGVSISYIITDFNVLVGLPLGARTFFKNGFNLKYYIAPSLYTDVRTQTYFFVIPGVSIGKFF